MQEVRKKSNLEAMTTFFEKLGQNPQILMSPVSVSALELLDYCKTRCTNVWRHRAFKTQGVKTTLRLAYQNIVHMPLIMSNYCKII